VLLNVFCAINLLKSVRKNALIRRRIRVLFCREFSCNPQDAELDCCRIVLDASAGLPDLKISWGSMGI
jgi:hypothetical protein